MRLLLQVAFKTLMRTPGTVAATEPCTQLLWHECAFSAASCRVDISYIIPHALLMVCLHWLPSYSTSEVHGYTSAFVPACFQLFSRHLHVPWASWLLLR